MLFSPAVGHALDCLLLAVLFSAVLGSKPGNPFGDVIYNFIAAKVLNEVHAQLENEGLTIELLPVAGQLAEYILDNPRLQLVDDTYADDTIIMGTADTEDLITALTTAAELTIQTFQPHGLQIKMKENKTEAVIYAAGLGKAKNHARTRD